MPLEEVLSDAKHGDHHYFELVTATITLEDGSEGTGYTYTGGKGGIVVLTADDPDMHSSQNEQDNRNYALAAKIPMLEPSDPAEAKEFLKRAFELGEELDSPVLLRITTRIAHVKGVVSRGEVVPASEKPEIEKHPEKFVMLPAMARKRSPQLRVTSINPEDHEIEGVDRHIRENAIDGLRMLV